METLRLYELRYAATDIQDIEEKADCISCWFAKERTSKIAGVVSLAYNEN